MPVEEIIAKAHTLGLFSSRPVRGCSATELAELEGQYGLTLPPDYRRFLELAGHESGFLFRWDHFDVSFRHALRMTREVREKLTASDWSPLPEDAFIICGRLGEQFEFIRTSQGDSSAVWYFSESDPVPKLEYSSFDEWLNENLKGAVDALASGYFAK